MRRNVGVAAIAKQKRSDEKFKDKKSEIEEISVEEVNCVVAQRNMNVKLV